MTSSRVNRWYNVPAFLGAVVIPMLVTFGPLALRDSVPLVTTLAAAEFVYLSVLLSTVLRLHVDFERRVKGVVVMETISEAGWYPRFSEALRNARTRVKISYMSNKSPLDSVTPETRSYYRKLSAEIRRKTQVDFKRLVRAVPGLRSWIEAMVEDLGNVANFSLACLPDQNPDDNEIPTISVQCVDDDQVFFVAVGEQQESRGRRDMYIESEDANRIWSQYYERLWSEAIVVINRGIVDQVALAKVRETTRANS